MLHFLYRNTFPHFTDSFILWLLNVYFCSCSVWSTLCNPSCVHGDQVQDDVAVDRFDCSELSLLSPSICVSVLSASVLHLPLLRSQEEPLIHLMQFDLSIST